MLDHKKMTLPHTWQTKHVSRLAFFLAREPALFLRAPARTPATTVC
jgi:hypothetical protein